MIFVSSASSYNSHSHFTLTLHMATDTVLMIDPGYFGFNEEASITNKFQRKISELSEVQIRDIAALEFQNFVETLSDFGVDVIVVKDTNEPETPDAVFPNNWISTHTDGTIVTYPMATASRRLERRQDVLDFLTDEFGYSNYLSMEESEEGDAAKFLEGTGSMVMDHEAKVIYAALSPRTDSALLKELADKIGYTTCEFTAHGKEGELVYHTNVMMCVAENYAVVGMDTIVESDRQRVMDSLTTAGKEIIALDNTQVYQSFAGNMLQLRNQSDETILVMSTTAYDSLLDDQLKALEGLNDHVVHVPIHMIELIGGGSARCMMAEIYKPI